MIKLYFGLPGSGKTSILVCMALDALKKGRTVYCNVPLSISNPNFIYVKNEWIGRYAITDGLLLIDEGEIFADPRAYKTFARELSEYMMLHRHYGVEIRVFSQRYNGVDVKIRALCQSVSMVKRGLFGLTRVIPIEYRIVVPTSGDDVGEIKEGYRMPGLLSRLFCRRYRRRRAYAYFDSWAAPALPQLPNP